jgi:hypothetical protein
MSAKVGFFGLNNETASGVSVRYLSALRTVTEALHPRVQDFASSLGEGQLVTHRYHSFRC